MNYHFNDKAAQTVVINQQLLVDQYLTRDMAACNNFYQWYSTQTATATLTDNPAILYVREKIHWEMFNTGASILYLRGNIWTARQNIPTVAGQTDTIADMIAHGQALMAPTALGGTAAFATTEPGYNLFLNPYFCKYWKAGKRFSKTLLPGERFTITMKDRYVYNQKETEIAGTAPVSFQKGCKHFVGFVFGQPSFDVNGGAAPTAIGSAAGGLIGYVLGDAKLAGMPVPNSAAAQKTTTWNQATAGHVWQPIASNEATVTLF